MVQVSLLYVEGVAHCPGNGQVAWAARLASESELEDANRALALAERTAVDERKQMSPPQGDARTERGGVDEILPGWSGHATRAASAPSTRTLGGIAARGIWVQSAVLAIHEFALVRNFVPGDKMVAYGS